MIRISTIHKLGTKQISLLIFLANALFFLAQPTQATTQMLAWGKYVDEFVEGYFKLNPSFAVNAGRHEFDGKLPDWSFTGLEKTIAWLESQRDLVKQYRSPGLNDAEQFEQQYLLSVINGELFWLKSAQTPFKNPMFYAGSLDPNVYVSRAYAPLEQRLQAFTVYAQNIPKATEDIRHNLRLPLPKTYINTGKLIFGGLAKFYEKDAKTAFAEIKNPALQHKFADSVKAAANAMRGLVAWLEQQEPKATNDFAFGSARFQEMLKATEGIDTPLIELEKAGRADLERNLTALKATCQHYAPKLSVTDCVTKVKAQKPKEGAVAAARSQLDTLKAFVVAKNLVSIPSQDNAKVEESPPYQRWNSAYIDIPGPYEQHLPSIYYVAPPDPAWSKQEQADYIPSKADLLFISVHEVWPGHFLQFLHAHQVKSKIGRLFNSYAYSEGWAHYSEELMWEAGLQNGDDEAHIGQLLNALLRNVRFLSAIGLHTQGMTVQESEKMFRELAFKDEANARQQAARGTFDPAYLNYTLGKLLIRKLREEWTATSSGKNAWKTFHDAFLSYGSPPIPLVGKVLLKRDKSHIFQ